MHIDETRTDDTTVCVNNFRRIGRQFRRNVGNAAVFDPDIRRESLLTGCVSSKGWYVQQESVLRG
jgi:hypothetical protein